MLTNFIATILNEPQAIEEIRTRQDSIQRRMLTASAWVKSPNFTFIHDDDLQLLFRWYDETFFQFAITREIRRANSSLGFRMSSRLTSAGAKTLYFRSKPKGRKPFFEIAVSTTLLAESFQAPDQVHTVVGLPCATRIDALQRLFEHELIHLIELLVFKNSSCTAHRFKTLATNTFGHRCSHHELLRPVDRARMDFGIAVRDRVSFQIAGRKYEGVVNRITKRATVLVPDANGERFSDGRCYLKFLVPVDDLTRLSEEFAPATKVASA